MNSDWETLTLYDQTLQQNPRSPIPAYAQPSLLSLVSTDSRTNVSFQNIECGDLNSQTA